ncbi:MAG: ATP-binding cassette domain-containing protein [Verrucomicrobia bacterium]|nr:ATP-binding cassette domain-containing protein [Verrucomicrobiota bacterium]
MLTLSQLSKSFGGRTLFSDVSLQINREDRIGLVGPNGAGKSTLFSLILGESSPDDGKVSLERNVTLGFLPQESAPAGDETILELACATSPEMSRVQRAIQRHEAAGTLEDPEYHEALDTFTELGGWQLEPRAKQILSGLAFRDSDFHRKAKALSGGWIMRAHLARLLVQEPDLLLLDEPTNHLDLESLVWFQEYLRTYPGAILMISHDREFLNELVGSIVEISQNKLHRYRGNYDKYVVEKAAREEQHLAAYKNQQREIASLQEFADRFRAKASKASQAQSKLKQIDRMDKIEAPVSATRSIKFRFPQPVRSGLRVITLKDVDHTYKNTEGSADLTVYQGLNFEAERGQRTVLVGPNGAGKSTLLKLLGGALPIQQGERLLGHNVRVGYFSQHRGDTLNLKHQVLESVLDSPNPVNEQIARTVLGSFLFRGDDVFKTVGVLSGGEKSRLALVKLLLDPPNLLLMDEPTTHLDIGSIDALIQALHQYEGTLLFISHDVHFIRAMATTVLHISAGQLTPYAGDYQYYLEKSKATSARAALTAGEQLTNSQPVNSKPSLAPVSPEKTPTPRKTKEQKRAEAEARQEKSRLKKAHQSKVSELEKRIHALETRLAEITAELEKPETYQANGAAVTLSRESATVSATLEQLIASFHPSQRRLRL